MGNHQRGLLAPPFVRIRRQLPGVQHFLQPTAVLAVYWAAVITVTTRLTTCCERQNTWLGAPKWKVTIGLSPARIQSTTQKKTRFTGTGFQLGGLMRIHRAPQYQIIWTSNVIPGGAAGLTPTQPPRLSGGMETWHCLFRILCLAGRHPDVSYP